MEKNETKVKLTRKVEIIVAVCILLFSIEPFLKIRIITLPFWYVQKIYYSIHEKYFLSKDEVVIRSLYKIKNNMIILAGYINIYFAESNNFIYSIEDAETAIKSSVYNGYFEGNEKEYKLAKSNKLINDMLIDPYGNKYVYDSNNYEIYCNNDNIIKFINGKNERKSYVINVMDLRVICDMRSIYDSIAKFYKEKNKYPLKMNELNITLPFEKWGQSYELDFQNYEIICVKNKNITKNFKQ